jgi:hypothetical protein
MALNIDADGNRGPGITATPINAPFRGKNIAGLVSFLSEE